MKDGLAPADVLKAAGGFGNPITRIGGESVPGYFTGQLAEVGYTNVISTAGIAAYSQCQYGI